MIEIHPDAAVNFNEKGFSLIPNIKSYQDESPSSKSFPTDIITKASITDKDIISFKPIVLVNGFGDTTGFYFIHNGNKVGIFDSEYSKLLKLSECISKTKDLKNRISESTIRETIHDWVEGNYKKEITCDLCSYILGKSKDIIKELKCWVPINYLHIQTPFKIGKVTLQPISREMLDNLEETMVSRNKSNIDDIKAIFNQKIRNFQGYVASTMIIEAERKQAEAIILDETEKSLLALKLFTPGAFHPKFTTFLNIWGCEQIQTTNVFSIGDNFSFQLSSGIKGPSPQSIMLNNDIINKNYSSGLSLISKVLENTPQNDFQKQILDALLIYSRCASTTDLANKLIYILSALESIFLRNNNEPIQQNLSERIAFLIGREYKQRKKIIGEIRDGYSVRSAFVHHGATIDDYEILEKFMWNSWLAITTTIRNLYNFTSKEDFLDKLDEMKLS